MMDDREFDAIIESLEADANRNSHRMMRDNELHLDYYMSNPFGDEVKGRSQVVTTDVSDLVDSDMTSLVRVFLGAQQIMKFNPTTNRDRDVKEAEQKTAYINHIVKNQRDSFKTIFDWIKSTDLYKCGVVRYDYEENIKKKTERYTGLTVEEAAAIQGDIEEELSGEDDEYEIETETDEDGKINLTIDIKHTRKEFVIRVVPPEEFRISTSSRSKWDAELVGDERILSAGDVVAMGFDEELVKRNIYTNTARESSRLKDIRFQDEGGAHFQHNATHHWTTQPVRVGTYCVKIDYDEDGIPERRRIVKIGDEIAENEEFDHVNYAIMSAILMPNDVIGRSRAELAMQDQRVKSVLYRNLINNTVNVSNGRIVVDTDRVNADDLLLPRPNGIVRGKGDPRASVSQLNIPYVGQEILQVVQYVDQQRAARAGQMLASQGLEADQLYKETATRFEGVEDANKAKIELVARSMAETGFKELFEGLAWMVGHFQDEDKEVMVLGEQMMIRPSIWRYDQCALSNIGLGAGDNEKTLENMGQYLGVLMQLKQAGSTIVDDKKIYNTIQKLLNAMGEMMTSDYINDPEKPQELLLAQNEQLMNAVEQLQQQVQQNPLAEAETIKAQARLLEAQGQSEIEAQKMERENQRFMLELLEEQRQNMSEVLFKIKELEVKQQTEVREQEIIEPRNGR